MNEQLECILEANALLGESPSWHEEGCFLYWVDIQRKELHVFDPETMGDRIINVGQLVGCVVPRKSGGVALALQNGFAGLDIETEKLTFLVDPESNLPANRFNDGKCDPAGRFLAGTMAANETPGAGSLYSLDTDLQVSILLTNLSISNGIGWSPDYSVMYFIDTPTRQIQAFDYDLDRGSISRRRVAVTIPDGAGYPDGMTTDEEGMIWVAMWGGAKVIRVNPKTGTLLRSVSVPSANVTSCVFGGSDRNELYITTARMGMGEIELNRYPQAGGLFRLKTDIIGIKTFEFGG
jgi:sugar lactone lactonase YvrE